MVLPAPVTGVLSFIQRLDSQAAAARSDFQPGKVRLIQRAVALRAADAAEKAWRSWMDGSTSRVCRQEGAVLTWKG